MKRKLAGLAMAFALLGPIGSGLSDALGLNLLGFDPPPPPAPYQPTLPGVDWSQY